MKGEGDCYEAAVHAMLEMPLGMRADAMLVHGTVIGTAGDVVGQRFGHAWVELAGDVVLDGSNGHSYVGRRETYYSVGSVEVDRRYTFAQMMAAMARAKHYGPWPEGL